jgi:hypothetical protein
VALVALVHIRVELVVEVESIHLFQEQDLQPSLLVVAVVVELTTLQMLVQAVVLAVVLQS